jgi:hypothetical protein
VSSDGSCAVALPAGSASGAVEVHDQEAAECVIDVRLEDGTILEGSLTFQYWGGCCGYGNSVDASPFEPVDAGSVAEPDGC